jgi:hypothetical protein
MVTLSDVMDDSGWAVPLSDEDAPSYYSINVIAALAKAAGGSITITKDTLNEIDALVLSSTLRDGKLVLEVF